MLHSIGVSVMIGMMALAGPPEASDGLRYWEDQITLPTYGWEDNAHPVFQEYEKSIYYPWTRQDYLTGVKKDRTYKTLNLENPFLRVTCIPELGGRIYSVLDKTTNEEMFHKNDVIKPALIAMRGAWISGGIEWNVGPQGHTVFIMEPVLARVCAGPGGEAMLIVGATDKTFGTRWEVRLKLWKDRACLDEEIRLINPTDGVQPYYFWNNTAFPNRKGTRFIYPMTLGCDHAGTSFFTWPEFKGRDITWLKNYDVMTSVFGYRVNFDFFGAYDADRDRGIVSAADHRKVPGKKAWTWGQDDFGIVSQMSLTEVGRDESQYIEVQSGPLLTQADFGMLQPQQTVQWQECWYPAHGLGQGFEFATRDAVVQATRSGGTLTLEILGTGLFPDAACTVSQDGKTLTESSVPLTPAAPCRVSVASVADGPAHVRVWSKEKGTLLEYDTPLAIPKVDPPDLTKKPAVTADELFQEAWLLDSQSSPVAAREGYQKVLAVDPGHVKTLCALAVLDNEQGRCAEADTHARKAVEKDADNGDAWYQLGVACLRQGRFEEARSCGEKAAQRNAAKGAALNLVGRAEARLHHLDTARALFAKALEVSGGDMHGGQYLAAITLAMSPRKDTEVLARDMDAADPTSVFAAVVGGLAKGRPEESAVRAGMLGKHAGFAVLESAALFADLGMYRDAAKVLGRVEDKTGLFSNYGPYPDYCRAYYAAMAGGGRSAKYLDKAAKAALTDFFPHGTHALEVLQWAATERPKDAKAHYLLGIVLAGLHRIDDAVPCWEKATALDAGVGQAWRLLGLHYWKNAKDLAKAESCYCQALAALPNDQIVLRDLTEVLTALNRRPEAILLAEKFPSELLKRYDLGLWLAKAYADEKRYDDCIAFLGAARFSNWEGVTTPRDTWVGALVERGKQRLEAGRNAEALADFQAALTYPANLGVGQRYKRTDAEVCYWNGRALQALGRLEEARDMWQEGASQLCAADPPETFITVTPAQDEHVKKCREALQAPGR